MNPLNPAAFVNPALTGQIRPQCIIRPGAMSLMHPQAAQVVRPIGLTGTLGVQGHFASGLGAMNHLNHPGLIMVDQQSLLQHQQLLQQQQQQQLLTINPALNQQILTNQVLVRNVKSLYFIISTHISTTWK